MAKRFEEIDLYGNREVQLNLFDTIENNRRLNPTSFWPRYARGEKYIREILENPDEYTGLDLEFDPNTNKPTILGLSNSKLSASMPFDKKMAKFIVDCAKLGITKLVGYSVIGAEKEVLEQTLQEDIPLECFEDGMITHFLLNQDLVKMSQGKEESEKGSIGFLNLWTMNTFYAGLPQFKVCRELNCKGPCPKHDVWGYNSMDSYVARVGLIKMFKEMKEKGIPYPLYRDLLEINLIAQKMQNKGIKVDRDLVEKLDRITDEEKEKLFPYTGEGKKRKYEYFNPNSPAAAINWFAAKNIELEKWNSESIYAALEEVADNENTTVGELLKDVNSQPIEYQLLIKGYQYKGAGKGFKSWFDDKFFGKDGLIHPRFLVIGTSTGRFSSRNPNFQNIPSYDEDTPQEEQSPFAQARVAIIPRNNDLCLIKADKSNLEFRMCVDPWTKILKKDLTWICAKDLSINDELIGFDEDQNQGMSGSKFRKSLVTDIQFLKKKSYTIETDRGSLTAADDHLVVVIRKSKKGSNSRVWVEMKDIKEGDILPFTTEPWESEESYEAGYISGFMDGEGWCGGNSKNGGFVCVSQHKGETLNNFKNILNSFGVNYSERDRKPLPQYTKEHSQLTITGIWESLKFLGRFRPERLLQKSNFIWEGRRTWGKNGKGKAVVKKVKELIGDRPLVCITTSTKTYISNGFLSHNCMWYAGFDTYKIEKDAFQWMVDTSDGAYKDAAKFLGKSERFVAKSVAHGSNYGEGIILLDDKNLSKKTTKEAIKMGAIVLYEDWDYCGCKVGFSGVNLASRLFKDTSLEARAKANQILEGIYFKKFHIIREWHKKVLTEVENTGIIRSALGRFVRLNDTPVNNAKNAFSFLGQGTSADHVQGDMLEFYRLYKEEGIPLLQVHDELVFEKPKTWSDEEAISFLSVMEKEDKRIPGFICPVKMYRGENWAQIKRIK